MLEWSCLNIFSMKKSYTSRHTHSLMKMSTLGLILGISGAFVTIFGSQALPSYAAPSWLWSIVGNYNTGHTLGTFDTTPGGGNGGQLTFISELVESTLGGS